jgi:hypothetical protein
MKASVVMAAVMVIALVCAGLSTQSVTSKILHTIFRR